MFINHSSKQVTAKIVYYGPGLSGKTTNLQYIFSVTNPRTRGELVSIETDVERTLFFDLLPINVGLVNGYQTKFQLYTVPGQVFYDSTRQLVLKGADGVVFVADSQELMENANKESLENLKINLSKHNQDIREIPVIFQYNKQDLQNTFNVELLNKKLNYLHSPFYGAVATRGTGVIETLREISSLTLKKIKGLLDQSLQVEKKRAFVQFDTNEKHAIIKRDELPLKKVSVKTVEDFHSKISFTDEKEKALPLSHEKTRVEEREDIIDLDGFEQLEEIKKVPEKIETSDEIPELKGFDDLEEAVEFPEVPEVPEIFAPVMPEIPGMPKVPRIHMVPDPPKIDEIPELVGFDDDELQIEIEDDTKEFDDVISTMGKEELHKAGTLPEVPFVVEPPVVHEKPPVQAVPPVSQVPPTPPVQPKPSVPPTPPVQPKPSVPPVQPKPPVQTIPPLPPVQKVPEVKKPEESKRVEAVRREEPAESVVPPRPQPIPQPTPQPVSVPAAAPVPEKKKAKSTPLDFLDRLKDDSRITIIKKINKLPKNNGQMVIEVKDDESHLMEPIKVTVTPGTKKITLIIDVK